MASVLLLVMSLSLFPYTTLFRSSELSEPDGLTRCAVGSCEGADMGAATALEAPSARTMPEAATAAARRPADPTTACPKDRKSTRLNSSHVAISYAVFCLTKQNTL